MHDGSRGGGDFDLVEEAGTQVQQSLHRCGTERRRLSWDPRLRWRGREFAFEASYSCGSISLRNLGFRMFDDVCPSKWRGGQGTAWMKAAHVLAIARRTTGAPVG